MRAERAFGGAYSQPLTFDRTVSLNPQGWVTSMDLGTSAYGTHSVRWTKVAGSRGRYGSASALIVHSNSQPVWLRLFPALAPDAR